jgi:hypothetical protein
VKLAVQFDPVFVRRSGSSLEQNQFLPEEPTSFSVLIFDYRPIGDRYEHICRSSYVTICAVEVLHHVGTSFGGKTLTAKVVAVQRYVGRF